MTNPRVTIITAIQEEFEAIKSFLHNPEDVTDHESGYVYLKGVIASRGMRPNCAKEWDVFLPMWSTAGNVFSAIKAGMASTITKPDIMLMVGCAGGIPGKINTFDVVVGSRIWYYEPGVLDGKDLIPRPDLARPTKRLFERAQMEAANNRWISYLHPNLPNEEVTARAEPIAAGELLIKTNDKKHLEHIRRASPRAIAVEQEGFGLLMAAYEAGVSALVIRGISDLLADKTDPPVKEGRVPALDSNQSKATLHAAAFAFCVLDNLDVTYLRSKTISTFRSEAIISIKIATSPENAEIVRKALDILLVEGGRSATIPPALAA